MIDHYNQRILEILKNNARISFTQLAGQVHLTAPAVTERIRKLENSGYIKGYSTKIDYQKLGFTINAWVQAKVFLGKEPEFIQRSKSHKNIIECYNVTGEKAFLMHVSFTNMDELNSFLDDYSQISETNTMMILSKL